MKLYTYQVSTPIGKFDRIGSEYQGKVIDLNLACTKYLYDRKETKPYDYAAFLVPPNMVKYFEGGEKSKDAVMRSLEFVKDHLVKDGQIEGPDGEQIVYEFNEINLLAPVPKPNVLRDCMVFLEHFRPMYEARGQKIPDVFYKFTPNATQNPANVIGTGESIIMPAYTKQLDYELELGAYIGKEAMDIPEDKATDYIAGFTIFNDVSARDIQKEESQLGLGPAKGKNFNHAKVMGPCMVTPDDLNFNNLNMIVRINGKKVSEDNSKDMYHKFPKIIAHISQDEYLRVGDLIASGTCPHGSSEHSSLGRWLQLGDTVEMEIEGIGVIRNQVVAKSLVN